MMSSQEGEAGHQKEATIVFSTFRDDSTGNEKAAFTARVTDTAMGYLRMWPGVARWLRPLWFTACTIILPVQLTLP